MKIVPSYPALPYSLLSEWATRLISCLWWRHCVLSSLLTMGSILRDYFYRYQTTSEPWSLDGRGTERASCWAWTNWSCVCVVFVVDQLGLLYAFWAMNDWVQYPVQNAVQSPVHGPVQSPGFALTQLEAGRVFNVSQSHDQGAWTRDLSSPTLGAKISGYHWEMSMFSECSSCREENKQKLLLLCSY